MPKRCRLAWTGITLLLFAAPVAAGEPALLDILCDDPGAEPVGGVSYSADGKLMLTAQPQQARVWDVISGKVKATLRAESSGNSAPFTKAILSPDGKSVATLVGARLTLWNVATGFEQRLPINAEESTCCLAYRPDGSAIAGGDETGVIRLWDSAGKPITVLRGHKENLSVVAVAFGPEGKRLASASNDGTVRIWNVQTGKCEGTWTMPEGWKPMSVTYSPDGKRVAVGGTDSVLRIWEVSTGKVNEFQQGGDCIMAVAFSPDARTLAASEALTRPKGLKNNELPGSWTTSIHLWDVETGKQLAALCRDRARWPIRLAFSPDGGTLAAAVFMVPVGGVVERWDIPRRK